MTFGSRLVIPGAIFGSIFLAVFLFMVTAGLTIPPTSLSSAPTPLPPVDQGSNAEDDLNDESVSDGISSNTEEGGPDPADRPCEVSNKFPDKVLQWCDLITDYSTKRGFPPDLIAALILQESGGNPVAYSKSGAVGLMQVMPRDGLASSFMCKNGPCFSGRPSIAELEDPEFNVKYGTRMLQGLVNKYGNTRDALKFYGPMDVGYYYADIVLGLFERYRK